MNTKTLLKVASKDLKGLSGYIFDLLTVEKPVSIASAINLSKVISKLSPLVGNLIEFNVVEFLNTQSIYQEFGVWKRQDPDFPDTIFEGQISPAPGFEIKAWFPLATEITARFKDSQKYFQHDQTYICLLAWLPDHLIFGKPRIIDVCILSGRSVAQTRDAHYHNPPDYLVLEPEDTSARTRNLQQSNTSGYKWQGMADEFARAEEIVKEWGDNTKTYKTSANYQTLLRQLMSQFPYRLDTNFAKIDRIQHAGIEKFKLNVLNTEFQGLTIREWSRLLAKGSEIAIREKLSTHLGITDADIDDRLL